MAEVKDYFLVHRRILRMVGLALEQKETWFYKFYRLLVGALVVGYFLILVFDILLNFNNFDSLIDSIYNALCLAAVICKFVVMTVNREKLDKTLKLLDQEMFAPCVERGGPIEDIWVEECVKTTNWLIIASCIVPLITVGFALAAIMIHRASSEDSQQWQLPFGIFSIFNPTVSPNFELAWICQMVMYVVAAVIYLVIDFLIVAVFSHISCQFKMLRNSMIRMVVRKDRSTNIATETLQKVDLNLTCLSSKLKENVMYYNAILDLAQQFEESLNLLVLSNYLAILVAVACKMYHGSMYPSTDPRFQKDAALMFAVLLQLFLISYFGDQITVESELVLSACYKADFPGTDIKFQKGLCIIMSRSQKPVIFTVGKFANLSLVTFVMMVRMSISYYMVLHSTNTME